MFSPIIDPNFVNKRARQENRARLRRLLTVFLTCSLPFVALCFVR